MMPLLREYLGCDAREILDMQNVDVYMSVRCSMLRISDTTDELVKTYDRLVDIDDASIM